MMKKQDVQREIEKLRNTIRRHDYLYYVLSEPEISDGEYDSLLHRLKELEEAYPEFKSPASPTQRVIGGVLEGFKTVRHKIPMLSLDNTYVEEEVREWERRLRRFLNTNENIDYMVELKIDGVSCSLIYEKGVLRLASTRGDGEVGEDVTANIRTVKSVPLKLLGKSPQYLEVRGEVYINKSDFARLNRERKERGESLFANSRNAASGSLKLLEPRIVAERNLRFLAHSFGQIRGENVTTQEEFLSRLREWGLKTDIHSRYCKNLEEVLEFYNYWKGKREELEYEADGVVIKVNSFSLQKALGHTLKSPRWAVAYKFPAHQATTKVENVIIQVGRTGVITPVAVLKPVSCGGVTISRATLHNFDEVRRLKLKIGDWVLVERAGDVIPKIVKVIFSRRQGKERLIKLPQKCPACGKKIIKLKEEEVAFYCINPRCPAQIKKSLLHFAKREAMDIEGLGESVVNELVDRGLIKDLADIYFLKKEDLLKLPLFADKKADNLLEAIEKSKKAALARFLYGLGIKHIGYKAAQVLADSFPDIEDFFHLKLEDIENLPDMGRIMAESVTKYFSQAEVKELISKFKKAGMVWEQERGKKVKGSLGGKKFVFTGELSKWSRYEAEELVRSLGGEASSSVSKKTDFVVVGNNPGSKLRKAKELGIKIISEEEFERMVKE
ncbi:MAG: NAD-dependent DNA ligase LigA [Candidatus Omnitrophica bacterium]|nr:NAD-dependent DNA ligase LigA [Candidatus Omnitrophota bacterium]